MRASSSLLMLSLVTTAGCTLAVDNRHDAPECTADDECDNDNTCDGAETCDLARRACVSGAPLSCGDSDECTLDSCDEQLGCVVTFHDTDGDGFAPATCEATGEFAAQGGDCDDKNSARHPGATVQCNGIDDDCDMDSDESSQIVSIPCFRDRDGDGYPSNAVGDVMMSCACPAGYVPGRTDGLFDCLGRDGTDATTDFTAFALIHPNPVASAQPFCVNGAELVMSTPFDTGFDCGAGTPSFDYDCSGTSDRTNTTSGITSCAACISGYTDSFAPDCGGHGQFRSCLAIAITGCKSFLSADRPQTCK